VALTLIRAVLSMVALGWVTPAAAGSLWLLFAFDPAATEHGRQAARGVVVRVGGCMRA